MSGIKEGLSILGNTFEAGIGNIVDSLDSLKDKFTAAIANVGSAVTSLGEKFALSISDLKDNFTSSISSLRDKFVNSITDLRDKIVSGITDMRDKFLSGITNLRDNVVSAVTGIGTFIIDGIKNLFLPEEGFFDEKVNYLCSRFSFAESIVSSASSLVDTITKSSSTRGPVPPSIVLDIEIYGTTKSVTVIDMSWYAPYKRYGDMVISGMIWIFFIWRVFVRLPGIIAGGEGLADAIFSFDPGPSYRAGGFISPKSSKSEGNDK